MVERIVVVLPGTPETSRNIAGYLKDLDVEIKIIPVIRVEVDWEEVERARKLLSSNINIDLSIFTSKTAVRIVKNYIPEAWKHVEKRALAIGPGTASLLKFLGVRNVETPIEHSSKGLISILSRINNVKSLTLYCSKDVNTLLEEFIEEKFYDNMIFKLYFINEIRENVKKIVKLVKSHNSKKFVVILSSAGILRTLLSERELVNAENVIFSVFSMRLLEEAARRGVHIHHHLDTYNLRNYYIDLREHIRRLLGNLE